MSRPRARVITATKAHQQLLLCKTGRTERGVGETDLRKQAGLFLSGKASKTTLGYHGMAQGHRRANQNHHLGQQQVADGSKMAKISREGHRRDLDSSGCRKLFCWLQSSPSP